MRKQIAAANWKMNLTYQNGEKLLDEILNAKIELAPHQQVIFAVPFPYLIMASSGVAQENGYTIAAQNCHDKENGAYTGEVSAEMLHSVNIKYCIVGHSERREFFHESGQQLADKVNLCFKNYITPIFCCGESLSVREKGEQNDFVQKQLEASVFHLSEEEIKTIIIAYEPVWAIGTGKTASSEQAQEMHKHIRSVIEKKFGNSVADVIPILYGGSVKAGNAAELFGSPDVDGGLVGGASLVAQDFIQIIKALK
jgi:triosephosphate isomerase (TIM)